MADSRAPRWPWRPIRPVILGMPERCAPDPCGGLSVHGAEVEWLYTACEAVKKDVRTPRAEPVPLQIRNGVTGLMREQGYGKGYEYAHDTEEKLTRMQCMPDSLKDFTYYHPTQEGEEKKTAERLEEIKNSGRNRYFQICPDYL